MKDKYLRIVCVSVLACIVLVTLLGASGDTEKASVERLLIKRTDIMESVLSGEISMEEGKNKLREIEEGKLYSNDIKRLADNMNCEHNKVIDMKINELIRTSRVSDLMTFSGCITWKCSGINGIYIQKCNYTIGAVSALNGIKLVSFEIDE